MVDIDELLAFRLEARPNIPCFLVGHSMGGGNALYYALQGSHRDRLAGTIAWSPMLQLVDKPLGLIVSAGKLGAKFLPNKQMVQKLPVSYMSRDQSVCDNFANDPVC
jgi:acylglycerol lipase